MNPTSKLTFNDLTKHLPFVKVVWNGKVIFDDLSKKGETIDTLKKIELDFGDRVIYNMRVEVVMSHHCILYIKGE